MSDKIEKNKMYRHWLASIPNISNEKKRKLLDTIVNIEDVYNIEEMKKYSVSFLNDKDINILETSRKTWDLTYEYEQLLRKNVHLVTWGDKEYPLRLRPYKDAPFALFYKGKLPDETRKSVAIVGARRCSRYGEKYACEYGRILAENHVQVISGLAKGVDGLAQRSALQAKGDSYGVLGCGVDICYPREHIGLYQDLCNHGGVISEFPLGTDPLGRNFPLRNRIISAFADVILVIEAKEKSGSLITADMALEQGKEVYALPGPVDDELSKGCNNLIKQGAGMLNNTKEFMEEIGIYIEKDGEIGKDNKIMLESKEKLVYSCLRIQPQHVEWISEKVNLPIYEVMNLLVSLELKGYIKQVSKSFYVKI